MALLKNIANSSFGKKTGGAMMALGLLTMPFAAANANGTPPQLVAARSDNVTFIDCKEAACAPFDASDWSEINPYTPAVSIRMGTKKLYHPRTGIVLGLQDYKDKIEELFAKNSINHVQFFVEKNDAPATSIYLHVKGGTDGPYVLNKDLITGITMASIDAKAPLMP